MSLHVDVALEHVRASVSRKRIAEIAEATLKHERVRDALVSITLVRRAAIAALNQRHLRHRRVTDVISFGFARATSADPVVGDIYISPEVGRDNARDRGVPIREELARLVVHGVLHVLGRTHPDGAGRERSDMWTLQERLVRRIAAHASRR
jgi:probable rRNA maturation factor